MDSFWQGKRVLITGHTGFKGAWLSLWLQQMGAAVIGYALPAPTDRPNLFNLANVAQSMQHYEGDIANLSKLQQVFQEHQPEIVLHLAAQSLVRESYTDPVRTYAVNVMGTVNVLEAARQTKSVKVIINVTSDKCYENHEWVWGYRENDRLGGFDPYSNSKACAELVSAAYRNSFFNPAKISEHGKALATVRAGNVIGGGDWAEDRLIPDIIRAFCAGQSVLVRHPKAVRPWQHVLEPLGGYLLLAERLWYYPANFASAWNFGPVAEDARPVSWIVEYMVKHWHETASWTVESSSHVHEAQCLKLDINKANFELAWKPFWTLEQSLDRVVKWYQAWCNQQDLRQFTFQQIQEYRNISGRK